MELIEYVLDGLKEEHFTSAFLVDLESCLNRAILVETCRPERINW